MTDKEFDLIEDTADFIIKFGDSIGADPVSVQYALANADPVNRIMGAYGVEPGVAIATQKVLGNPSVKQLMGMGDISQVIESVEKGQMPDASIIAQRLIEKSMAGYKGSSLYFEG